MSGDGIETQHGRVVQAKEIGSEMDDLRPIKAPKHKAKPGPQHDHEARTKLLRGKFDATNLRRGHDIAGDPDDEQVVETLAEEHLGGDPGVGAADDHRERGLLGHLVLLADHPDLQPEEMLFTLQAVARGKADVDLAVQGMKSKQ